MRYIIYKLTFPNKKVYIGQTNNFNKRLIIYKYDAYNKKSKRYNRLISKAIRKYDWNNVKKEIILYCEENQIDYYERELIKLYKSNNKLFGYNLESGGSKYKHHSEISKQLMRKAHLGKKASDKTKKKMSESRKGKRGISLYGKLNHFYNKQHTEETKQLMRKAHLGKTQTKEAIEKRVKKTSKPILCFDKQNNFIQEFKSSKQASIELKLNSGTICKVLKGVNKSTHGLIFKYKNGNTS